MLAMNYRRPYQAAEMGDISEGDTVVVFGARPVGIFAAKCAWLMGAGPVIVVDQEEYRLEFVRQFAQCETVDFKSVKDMAVHIKQMTDGLGADVCIDAVGCEAAGSFAQTMRYPSSNRYNGLKCCIRSSGPGSPRYSVPVRRPPG